MPRVNGAEFAALFGCTGSYISQKERAKVIARGPDGKFDFEEEAAKLRSKTDPAKVKRKKLTPDLSAAVEPIATEQDAQQAVSLIKRVLQEEGREGQVVLDFDAIRSAESILKTRERYLAIEVESGRLVDRAELEKLAFEAANDEVSAWTNWPARVAAQLAADIGAEDAITTAIELERHVREHLAERSTSGKPQDKNTG